MKKSELNKILKVYEGTNMFMVLNEVKLNLFNVIFRKKKLLKTIEFNYIILESEKQRMVSEIREHMK